MMPEWAPKPSENHVLDVYLQNGRAVDLVLDGESLFPVWFKIEWKETGEVSAKVKGVRLATRFGDAINIHNVVVSSSGRVSARVG